MTTDTLIGQTADYADMLHDIKAIAKDLRGIQELGVARTPRDPSANPTSIHEKSKSY